MLGDFAAGLIAGKKVVHCETAAELGDTLPVPVHHSMSGPVLQVLAYESVVQGRALQTSGLGVALLGSVLLLLVFAPFFATRSWRSDIAVGVTAMVGLEAGATALQSIAPVAVLTAPWMFTIFLCFIVAIARRVEAQAREILTQRQAIVTRQALMDRMMENSFDGVVIADCGGQIAVFNEAAGEILKYQVEDAVGRPLDQLLPGATHSAAEFDILAADGILLNHIGPQEWGVIRGDGTTTYIEMVVGRVRLDVEGRDRRDQAREQTFYTFTFRDTSERKSAQEAQQRAMKDAIAANRAKTEFLAMMSHELRTPLNAVLGFSEIIMTETFGPVGSAQYRGYAEDIHESGKHLLDIINDILDLSKIESGTDELHEDKIEIPETIRAVLKMVGHHAEQGGIKLELELADQLPALRADERKLKQILVNLLSNAVKFTDAGGEVTLKAWCRMGSGYVFQITDTGIGMAPEDIPKALSQFGQVDADLNRKYEGTGLGLPLTKALVELHGGVLDLQSEVGVGTTVTVRFPAERIVRSPHDTKAISAGNRKAG